MSYLLFLLCLIIATVVSYFIIKNRVYASAYAEGHEAGFKLHEETFKVSDELVTQWDDNHMKVTGINPLKGIDICEKEHHYDNLSIVPRFGIKTIYRPNDIPVKRCFDVNLYCNYKSDKNIKIFPNGDVFDGYHTFNELYYYRLCYNAALINTLVQLINDNPTKFKGIKVCKSKKHFGGEPCYGGTHFIVMISTPWGQISNHYELKYWDMFNCPIAKQSWKWDGHKMEEAMERLNKLSKFIATGKYC